MVMYSTYGINWTSASAAEERTWQSVTYGNGKFVAVGSQGAVMYSSDGINWTSASEINVNDWQKITYGNGYFVAVANDGINDVDIMYSTDGISWTAASAPVSSSWKSVAYGNGWGRFVVVALSGTGDRVMYSRDVRDKRTQFNFGAQASTGYIYGQMNDNYQLSNNAMTISVWVKNLNSTLQTIVSKLVGGLSTGFMLQFNNNGVKFVTGDPSVSGESFATNDNIISLDKWYYITATCSLNSRKIYVNDVEMASASGLSAMPFNNGQWDLGGSANDGAGESFKGSLAMFKLYNKELTALEIKQNFDAFKTRFGY